MAKEIYGLLGTAFLMGGYAPYLVSLWRGTAKPHAFSWLLWGLINAIVFTVQAAGKAGPGAWTAGMAALFNLGIGLYALRRGERHITRGDWLVCGGALSAIPLWALTKDPLWSVVLVSVIDTLAFYPTLRKSWRRPHEEVATTFAMGLIGFALSLAALQAYNFTNVCYPAKVIVTNAVFILALLYRRKTGAATCPA
jgi:hypothetical protein